MKSSLEEAHYSELLYLVQMALARASSASGLLLAGNVVGPLGANRVVELSGDSITKLVALDSGATIRQMQTGTAAAPSTEVPLVLQPRLTTDGLAKSPFVMEMASYLFATTYDEVVDFGWNMNSAEPTLPTIRDSWETDYEIFPGIHQAEMHKQFSRLGGGGGDTYRWITSGFRYASHRGTSALQWRDGTGGTDPDGGDAGYTNIGEVTGNPTMTFATAGITTNTKNINFLAVGTWLLDGGTKTDNIAAPNSMVFKPQAPFAGATLGNRNPGNYEIDLAVPIAGGSEANVIVRRGVNIIYELSAGSTTWADATGASYFEIVLSGVSTQLVGLSPGTMYVSNNAGALQLTATTGVYLLAGAGDQCHFYVAGVELAQVAANGVANQTSLVVACDAANTLSRVTLGAANSGGAGFRVLRVPN